jgi:outer membrane protein
MSRWWTITVALAVVLLGSAPGARGQGTAAPGTPAASPPAGVGRIGFVEIQRVLARSAAGVAAREQLEREKTTMQREMEGRRAEMEKLREEIEKKGALMTVDTRREKEETLDRKRRDLARLADDLQREYAKKEQALAQRVLVEVLGVAEKLGKERGYYLILEKRNAGVVFSQPEADLTDEIIRAYDQQAGAKGKK